MSDLEDFLRDHHNPIVAQLNKEIADLRAKCVAKDDEYEQQVTFAQGVIANLRAELELTQTALGQSQADLMGCRDGALVRDLSAENERLRIVLKATYEGNLYYQEILGKLPKKPD